MTKEQIKALTECVEFIKDLVNANDAGEPYSHKEIYELGMKLLGAVHDSGVRLAGES